MSMQETIPVWTDTVEKCKDCHFNLEAKDGLIIYCALTGDDIARKDLNAIPEKCPLRKGPHVEYLAGTVKE